MTAKARAGGARRSNKREREVSRARGGQVRKVGARSWTKAKEGLFLTSLAETCNVTLAASDAGVSTSAAYARRKSHAAFRAAWLEAIGVAYRRLELVLLERAFNGSEKVMTRKDGSEERVREYPNAIALQLFRMYRETAQEAEREPGPGELDELREKLQRKVERLRKRLLAKDGAAE